jgi:hypothetical protein
MPVPLSTRTADPMEVAKLEAKMKQPAHQADPLRRLVERVPERAL